MNHSQWKTRRTRQPSAPRAPTPAGRHGRLPGCEVRPRAAVDEEATAETIDVSTPAPLFAVVGKALESPEWFLRGDIGKTVRVQLAVGPRTN